MAARPPVRRDGPPRDLTYRPPRPKPETSEEYQARHRFYGRKAWQDARAAALRASPFCVRCFARGEYTPATQVHHRVDLRDAPELAYELSNLEPLCRVCHSRETAERINATSRMNARERKD